MAIQLSTGGVSGDAQAWLGKKVFRADALLSRGVLTGNVTMSENDSEYQTADAGGVTRTWTLPNNDNQGLRYYITNIGTGGSFSIVDFQGNSVGTIPPVSAAFVVCNAGGWTLVSAEREIALQLRALIMTAYLNQGMINPGTLELWCKNVGCTYSAIQFALAKS